MRIAVCIVMIPKFEDVFVHRTTGELRAIPAIMNPADENALELALSMKDSKGGEVVAVSCGGESSDGVLRRAIAMGCDHAYHLLDERFTGSDPLATARILGEALKKIKPDLVICGSEALNGGQTGPRVAEVLGVPHFIEAVNVTPEDPPKLKRMRDDREEELNLSVPSLVTVRRGVNSPRIPKAVQIMRAHKEGVLMRWNLEDLGIDADLVGPKGSSTKVTEMLQ